MRQSPRRATALSLGPPVSDTLEQRLALEADVDRLAALCGRILLAARARRVGFLDSGQEAVATRLVPLGDRDLSRDAAQPGR